MDEQFAQRHAGNLAIWMAVTLIMYFEGVQQVIFSLMLNDYEMRHKMGMIH